MSRQQFFFLSFFSLWCPRAADQTVYVATGACDGEDKGCSDDASREQVIKTLALHSNGTLSMSTVSDTTDGLPVWLTHRRNCLIATLADKSAIYTKNLDNGIVQLFASGGVNPVFADVMNAGRTLLVANYHGPDNANTSAGASAASFQIDDKCALTLADVKNHSGHSINPSRQGGAHVHSFVAARNGLAYACDLGMDMIFTYAVRPNGKLAELARTVTPAGVGPRHLVQHPVKDFLYVVTEMGQSVLVYRQGAEGTLKLVQSLPLGDSPCAKSAEISITSDGSLVFATNRECLNTVTSFRVADSGELVASATVAAPLYPRGMWLAESRGDLDGSYLLVGGQSKTEVWSYRVGSDGALEVVHKFADARLPQHPATFTSWAQEFIV